MLPLCRCALLCFAPFTVAVWSFCTSLMYTCTCTLTLACISVAGLFLTLVEHHCLVEVLTGHLRLVLDVVELGIVLVTDLPKFVYLVACICDLPCCLTCLVSVLCSLVIVVVFIALIVELAFVTVFMY